MKAYGVFGMPPSGNWSKHDQLNCSLFAVQNRRVLKCKKATRNWRGLVS
jgi:hypothetical protein